MISDNISHTPGDSRVVLNSAGIYEVTLHIPVREPAQVCVMLNGSPVEGGLFAVNTTGSVISGSALISANEGDILTIQNVSECNAFNSAAVECSGRKSSGITLIIKKLF